MGILSRRVETTGVLEASARAVDYESSLAVLIRRSEQRAWRVATISLLVTTVLAAGYWWVMPLKEKQPFLVLADAYTGQASLARLQQPTVDASEVLDRANVATFIRARESYDWTQVGARDWSTVFTMAEDEVTAEYRGLYRSDNPKGPLAVYGRSQALRIRILSIQLFGPQGGTDHRGASIRFQRRVFDKLGGVGRFLDNRIATLEYTYKPQLAMGEEDRLLNPLGFRVTAYRVDTDHAQTPPLEEAELSAVMPGAAPAPPQRDGGLPAAEGGG